MNYCEEVYLSAAEKIYLILNVHVCWCAEKIINTQTWYQGEYGIKRSLEVIWCDGPSNSNTK